MQLFVTAEHWLMDMAQRVPVEQFTFIGAAVEEVIAPIPSPLVMTLAGSVAKAQGQGYLFLLFLTLIGAVGKTLASWVVYVASDKAEDVVVGRFGKYLGVSSKEIEQIGGYFNGGTRDTILMFLARAIPIMPTAPVSIVSGIVKVHMNAYMVGTFFGTLVRSLFYILLGYLGVGSVEAVTSGLESLESVMTLLLAVVGIVLVLVMYYRRSKESDILGRIKSWFGME